MKEYTGVLGTIGAGTYANSLNVGSNTISTISYIEIGDKIIKKVKAYSGICGELSHALGTEVTLYFKGRHLVGIKTQGGRTFASAGDNMFLNLFIFLSAALAGLVLSLVIIGLPILFLAWMMWGRLSAQMAARSLPDAILI